MTPQDDESSTASNGDRERRAKRPYSPPKLDRLGTIRELTLGIGMFGNFDQTHPPGQNKSIV